jgi:hypothetical protein
VEQERFGDWLFGDVDEMVPCDREFTDEIVWKPFECVEIPAWPSVQIFDRQ